MDLDLLKLKKLKKFDAMWFQAKNVFLPKNLESLSERRCNCIFEFENDSNLTSYYTRSGSKVVESIENMSFISEEVGELRCVKLSYIYFGEGVCNYVFEWSLLNKFPNLERLGIEGVTWLPVEDKCSVILGELNKLSNPNIKTLSINWISLTNLNDLSNLIGLKTLSVTNTFVTDISGISTLINLTNLTIINSKITDISVIGNFTKLTNLKLNNNFITTGMKSLESLLFLENIDLSNNSISDYDGYKNNLEGSANYQVLNVFKTLNESGKLKTLKISNNAITNFDILKGLNLNVTR